MVKIDQIIQPKSPYVCVKLQVRKHEKSFKIPKIFLSSFSSLLCVFYIHTFHKKNIYVKIGILGYFWDSEFCEIYLENMISFRTKRICIIYNIGILFEFYSDMTNELWRGMEIFLARLTKLRF